MAIKKATARRGRTHGVNKSDAIRAALNADPKRRNEDIIADLAREGLVVTQPHVSVVRARLRREANNGTRKPRREHSVRANGHSAPSVVSRPIAHIEAAKQLVSVCGGVREAADFMEMLASVYVA